MSSTSSALGHAWKHYRQGEANTAIAEFEQILKSENRNVDALYGIGLAQRAAGQLEAALKSFESALQIVKSTSEEQQKARREAYGDKLATQNDPTSKEDDRFMMLGKMLSQRVEETKAFLAGR